MNKNENKEKKEFKNLNDFEEKQFIKTSMKITKQLKMN
jgi:hypothetical protein